MTPAALLARLAAMHGLPPPEVERVPEVVTLASGGSAMRVVGLVMGPDRQLLYRCEWTGPRGGRHRATFPADAVRVESQP